MCFFEPIAGQTAKEAFTRLDYRKQTNSHEEAIHHLIGTKTSKTNSHEEAIHHLIGTKMSLFAYLVVHGIEVALQSLVLTKSSSVLSTGVFFTVHKTLVGSGHLYIYHVFSHWRSGSIGPRKSMYDTRPSLGACVEGVVWGRD